MAGDGEGDGVRVTRTATPFDPAELGRIAALVELAQGGPARQKHSRSEVLVAPAAGVPAVASALDPRILQQRAVRGFAKGPARSDVARMPDGKRRVDGIDAALCTAGVPEGAPVGVVVRNRPGHAAAVVGLLVAGTALLTMERAAFDNSGVGIEYGSHYYRPDLYSFEVTLVEK